MKINEKNDVFRWLYSVGFLIILFLPLLTLPPWFYSNDWGKTIAFRSIIAVLLCLFTWHALYKKNDVLLPDLKSNIILWLLAALFLVFLLASILSVDPYFSFWGSPLHSGGFVTFGFYIIFAIVTFLLFKKEDWRRAWIFSIGIGVLVAIVDFMQFYGLFNTIISTAQVRPSSTIGNPILLGIYMLLLLFPTLALFLKEKKIIYKIGYGLAIVLFLFVILISASRAAYLGFLAGVVYFLLAYPKKLRTLKILAAILCIGIVSIVIYINVQSHTPHFLEKNKFFQLFAQRLSIESLLNEGRFPAWNVGFKAFLEKPVLGWGPENYSVGFDKYYTPSAGAEWWDRAHNIPLEIATTAGLPALIIYLALFVILFWQLSRLRKNHALSEETTGTIKPDIIMAHSIQTTLIAYFIANLFSFDSFVSYLLFFFIIGYSLHLLDIHFQPVHIWQLKKYRVGVILCLFALSIFFIWQYNFKPLEISFRINKAEAFVSQKNCDSAFSVLNTSLSSHTFLDSYLRMKYVEFLQSCAALYPENNLLYANTGASLLKEALKIRPLYPRLWLYLGTYTNIIAINEQDPKVKEVLLKEAFTYFDKAIQLAPLHPEIFSAKAQTDMIIGDYRAMAEDSQMCISLYEDLGVCYFQLGLSKIYLGEYDEAKQNIEKAKEKKFNSESPESLRQLADAYLYRKDYKNLATMYIKLISFDFNVAKYHALLAADYKELGQYQKARQEALIFLELEPESKDEVNAFLRTFPY